MSERTTTQPEAEESTDSGDPKRSNTGAAPDSTPTQVTSGATSTVRALENAGIEVMFGVQGGAIMPVYDALWDSDIRHVMMAHEQGAAHAADAFSVVAGEPGVCLATSGPGATNLVTGLADANMDSDAVVALTGQVPQHMVGSDAFQETDTTGITAPITKNNYFASDADTVGDTVGEAVALASSGRPGPTLVDLPKDVTNDETDREPGMPQTPETYTPQSEADEAAVAAAARAIEAAEQPLLLFGGGVTKAGASEEARAFATDAPDFVFPDLPQGRSSIAVFTHPDNTWRYDGIDSLHDQQLLVINGYSYTPELDRYIDQYQANQNKIWVISGPSPLDRAIELLEQDRTDLYVEDEYVMAWWARSAGDTANRPRGAGRIGEINAFVAFSPTRKDSQGLAALLSQGTRQRINDGRAQQILNNYGLTLWIEKP